MMPWPINSVHPDFGVVEAMALTGGEAYRFLNNDGIVSMMPVSALGPYAQHPRELALHQDAKRGNFRQEDDGA